MGVHDLEWVAVIGTREPSEYQKNEVIRLVQKLDPDKHAVVSGCAYGVDALALKTANALGITTIGMLPWPAYNSDVQAYCDYVKVLGDLSTNDRLRAFDSVVKYHPNPRTLRQTVRDLHARNWMIIHWAVRVIAAPSSKQGGGGTGQGIRLTQAMGLPLTLIGESNE